MIKPKPPLPSFCDKVLLFLMLISFVQTCAAHNRIRRQDLTIKPPSPVPEHAAATLAELEKVCGISTVPLSPVVGGMPAILNAWPWMAAIFIRDGGPNTERVTCAGVVVSDFYVLTTSACVINRNTNRPWASTKFLVRLGDLDVNSDADGASPVDFDVSEVIPHPNYNQATVKNDIALIRLAKPAAFSQSITPICIPTADMRANKFERMEPHMAGWRTVEYRRKSNSKLQQVQLSIQSKSECQTVLRNLGVTSSDTLLCAENARGGIQGCQSDVGSPLMLTVKNKWYAIGVASMGYRCDEPDFLDVYTSTTEYIGWIKTTAKLQ